MQLMEILFVATGFTGGLTLVWLVRTALGLFSRQPVSSVQFGPGAGDRLAREIGAARREVLLLATTLSCPPVAQALVDAAGRKASVDVVLGPACQDAASDLEFLLQSGLVPLIESKHGRVSTNAALVDGRTLLVASGPLVSGEEQAAGHLLVFKDCPELIEAFREQMVALRGTAGQATARASTPAVPVFTLPPLAPPTPAPAPAPRPEPAPAFQAPAAPAPRPEPAPVFRATSTQMAEPAPQDEVFSYSYNPPAQPAPAPAPELPRMTATPAPEPAPRMAPPPRAAEAKEPPAGPALGEPPVTLAASELFARLRREVAAARELEAQERQAAGTGTPSLPANSTS